MLQFVKYIFVGARPYLDQARGGGGAVSLGACFWLTKKGELMRW